MSFGAASVKKKPSKAKKRNEEVVEGAHRGLPAGAGRATDGVMKATRSNNRANASTTMNPIMRHVGLDVHKDTIAVALADGGPGEPPQFLKTIANDVPAVERAWWWNFAKTAGINCTSPTKQVPQDSALPGGLRHGEWRWWSSLPVTCPPAAVNG